MSTFHIRAKSQRALNKSLHTSAALHQSSCAGWPQEGTNGSKDTLSARETDGPKESQWSIMVSMFFFPDHITAAKKLPSNIPRAPGIRISSLWSFWSCRAWQVSIAETACEAMTKLESTPYSATSAIQKITGLCSWGAKLCLTCKGRRISAHAPGSLRASSKQPKSTYPSLQRLFVWKSQQDMTFYGVFAISCAVVTTARQIELDTWHLNADRYLRDTPRLKSTRNGPHALCTRTCPCQYRQYLLGLKQTYSIYVYIRLHTVIQFAYVSSTR